jgi:hypothetical protein
VEKRPVTAFGAVRPIIRKVRSYTAEDRVSHNSMLFGTPVAHMESAGEGAGDFGPASE